MPGSENFKSEKNDLYYYNYSYKYAESLDDFRMTYIVIFSKNEATSLGKITPIYHQLKEKSNFEIF